MDDNSHFQDSVLLAQNKGYTCHRFKFELQLVKVLLNINFPCTVMVNLKRGRDKCETTQVDLINREGVYNEKFTFLANVYYDLTRKEFIEKKLKMTVVIVTQKGQKQAGLKEVDLGAYINRQVK